MVEMLAINVNSPVASALTYAIKLVRAYWFVLVPLVLVVRFSYFRYASPLRKYPGPFLASGSRAWKVWSTWTGKTENDHIKVHEKYGPVVRTAPNELSFSSPTVAKDVLAAGKGFNKTFFYWVFPPHDNPDIFTEIREDVHAKKKRYTSGPYSMATMQQMTGYIEDVQRLLMQKLDSLAKSPSASCNLGDWLHWFAFDVLGEVAFSRRFGFLQSECDVEGAIKFIDDIQWYDGIIGQIPEWDWVFRRNPLWKALPMGDFSKFLITRMAFGAMEERQKLGSKEIDRKDLLAALLAANEKAPEVFGMNDVFAVAHGAIFAGADSTASTMQSFLHFVLRDRTVYKTLVQEIDEAVAAGNISEMPQWSEVQALPYFQACLKEAMRLRPAVGVGICRYVPPGGAELDRVWYPGGTSVSLNAWVIHRNEAIFGRDAKAFRPERWLDDNSKTMDKYLFTFGGGSHLCIGKNLALLEMNKTLPLLLKNYDLELVRPNEDLKHHTTFFVVQWGLDVRIRKRNQ